MFDSNIVVRNRKAARTGPAYNSQKDVASPLYTSSQVHASIIKDIRYGFKNDSYCKKRMIAGVDCYSVSDLHQEEGCIHYALCRSFLVSDVFRDATEHVRGATEHVCQS